jgi:hypothetical protein
MRALLVVCLATGVAHADKPSLRPEAIEVDRDTTPPGQGELGFDGGAPIGDWAIGVTGGLIVHPIRFHTVDVKTYPVNRRETMTLGGALALGDSVILDAKLPVSHQVGQRLNDLGDQQPLDRYVPNDVTLGARAHVMTRGPVAVFVRGELALPSGDDHDFAGDVGWSVTGKAIARVAFGDVVLAATGGVKVRSKEVIVANQIVGDELVWAAGGTIGIPPVLPLWCEPAQLKASAEVIGVLGDRVNGMKGPSPIEARVGLIGRIRPPYVIAVRVGTHLDDQIGAPAFRATVDLVYQAR